MAYPPKRLRPSNIDLELDSDSECELFRKTTSSPRTHVDTWPRFIVVHSKTETKSASRINPFLVGETLRGIVGRPDATRLRSGDLLVECQKKTHATALLKLKKIGDYPVDASPHKSLNSCKGVVRNDALAEMEEGEILSNLKSQGVIAVKKFTFKRGGREVRHSTLMLTFGVPKLPERLWVGFCWARVTPFIPLPLRCFQCQRYGHGRSACKNKPVCVKCGEPEHGTNACSKDPKCVNCSGGHPSSSKDCPMWKEECAIQKVKTERKISFREARTIVTSQKCPQGQSYAAVVSSAPTTKTRQTVDCGSQTCAVFQFAAQPSSIKTNLKASPTHGARSELKASGTSGSLAKGVGQGSKDTRPSSKGMVSSTPNSNPKSPTNPPTPAPSLPKNSSLPKPTGPRHKSGPTSSKTKNSKPVGPCSREQKGDLVLKNKFEELADMETDVDPATMSLPSPKSSPRKEKKK